MNECFSPNKDKRNLRKCASTQVLGKLFHVIQEFDAYTLYHLPVTPKVPSFSIPRYSAFLEFLFPFKDIYDNYLKPVFSRMILAFFQEEVKMGKIKVLYFPYLLSNLEDKVGYLL